MADVRHVCRIVQCRAMPGGNVVMCTRTRLSTMRETRIYRIARRHTRIHTHTRMNAHIARTCTHVADHGRANICSIDLGIATKRTPVRYPKPRLKKPHSSDLFKTNPTYFIGASKDSLKAERSQAKITEVYKLHKGVSKITGSVPTEIAENCARCTRKRHISLQ